MTILSSNVLGMVPEARSWRRDDPTRRWALAALAGLGVLLVAYVAWLVLRPGFHFSVVMDGWLPDTFEIVVATICIARGVTRRPGRGAALVLGIGLLSWALGDLIWTIQSVVGATTLTDVIGAGFWLGFYPLAYMAILLLFRQEVGTLSVFSWLDGCVAGLGTAAICSAFAFRGLGYPKGTNTLVNVTNLAYPIGDVLLLALVVASTAILTGRRTVTWVLLAVACAMNGVGDTYNLFQSFQGPLRVDAVFRVLAWPAAGLVMTVAIWLRSTPRALGARRQPTGLVLPGIASVSGLTILIVGTFHRMGLIPLVLAVVTLLVTGIRLAWSAYGLRTVTEQRLRQSMTDELTGLANRRSLFDILGSYFANQGDGEHQHHKMAFLFLDLNHFKEVNDSFGHLAGDELLRQLGPRLTLSLDPDDVVVRFGGDEFAVVLMDAAPDYAASVARRLTASIKDPFILDGVSTTVSASIGIATAPTDANDTEGLLQCADIAMYRAKMGQSPFAFYDHGHDEDTNPWRLGDELRRAIDDRQFVLYYQPQLDLRSEEIFAVEALLRWRHPRLGILPPLKFLPLAERAGLMPEITALVLDTALAQAAIWHAEGRNLAVAVNISATNLLDEGFTDLVHRLLKHHRVPTGSLVLEITETSVIANFDHSKIVIEELRDLGLIVSIDDFGAGFTSLSFLGSLAVRELKLDCKLIIGLANEERERDRELVRSTIELGHALGLRVVAEGVEEEVILELLRDFGADLAQGYFISKPLPAESLDWSIWPVNEMAAALAS